MPAVNALKASFYVYPLINALHIASVGATFTCVLLMDLRILGLIRSIEPGPFLALMREAVVVALPLAILSGLLLFSIRAQEYATNPAFQIKMALLLGAGLNLAAYRRLTRGLANADGPPRGARVLAALSMIFWLSILIAGRFIGFI